MKVWYGGGVLTGGLGEPINDGTGQWVPIGASVKIGATDTGHDTGILIINRVSGTIRGILVKVNSNTWAAGGSWALKLMDYNGGSPTYQDTSITVSDGGTGYFEDTASNLTMTAGNSHSWKWVRTGGGTGDMRVAALSYAFEPSGAFAFQWNTGEKSTVPGSATQHAPPFGDNTNSTEINSSRTKLRIAGSIAHFGARAWSNTRTTDSVFSIQKGGVDIGSGITFAAAATGFVEDAGYGTPVSFALDDYLSIRVTGGAGGGTLEYTCLPITITPITAGEWQGGCHSGAGIVVNQGVTGYLPILGDCTVSTSTDGNAKTKAPFAMQLDRFRAYIRANSLGGGQTATLNIRKNGTIARSIVWNSGVTGEAAPSDSSALSVAAGDELDLSFVCTGGTGSAQFMNMEFRGTDGGRDGSRISNIAAQPMIRGPN